MSSIIRLRRGVIAVVLLASGPAHAGPTRLPHPPYPRPDGERHLRRSRSVQSALWINAFPLPSPFFIDRQSHPQLASRQQSGLSSALANDLSEISPAEILGPAERRRIVFLVPDVGISASIEQQARNFDGAILDCHVQRRTIAVPH